MFFPEGRIRVFLYGKPVDMRIPYWECLYTFDRLAGVAEIESSRPARAGAMAGEAKTA